MSAADGIATVRLSGPVDTATLVAIQSLPAIVSGRIALDVDCPSPVRPPSIADVVNFVAFNTGVSRFRITAVDRSKPAVRARFAAAWGARVITGLSLAVIGNALGRRDHTTVWNAVRQAENLRRTDPAFRSLTDGLAAHFAGVPA